MKMTVMPTICPKRFTCSEAIVASGIRTGMKKLMRISPIAPIARISNPMMKRNAGVRKLRILSSRSLKTKGFTSYNSVTK